MSLVSSLKRRREVDSAGFRYSNPTFASSDTLRHWSAEPLKKPCSAFRVGASSVL